MKTPDPKKIQQEYGHYNCSGSGHHWGMLMDMNIERLGWHRLRVQYCQIGRYDKNLSIIIITLGNNYHKYYIDHWCKYKL